MPRDRWIVFGLLNGSWIVAGLSMWLIARGLSSLFFSQGLQGPGFDVPVLMLLMLLTPVLSLGIVRLLFGRALEDYRPGLAPWSLPILYYFAFGMVLTVLGRILPPDVSRPAVAVITALVIGTALSWGLSEPPSLELESSPPPAKGPRWRTWASWLVYGLVGVVVFGLGALQNVVAQVTVGRTGFYNALTGDGISGFPGNLQATTDTAEPSPDHRLLAVGTQVQGQSRMLLIDMQTRQRLWQTEVPSGRAVTGVWTEHPRQLLVTGEYEKAGVLLDLVDGHVIRSVDDTWSFCRQVRCSSDHFTILPTGQEVTVQGIYDPTGAWLVDRAGRQVGARLVRSEGKQNQAVASAAISPDGQRVAAGYGDGAVVLYEPLTGRVLTTVQPHSDSVRAMVWSPDSRQLATSGSSRSCGVVGGGTCVRVTSFSDASTEIHTAWQFEDLRGSPSLSWLGNGRLLLEDGVAAFSVRVPRP